MPRPTNFVACIRNVVRDQVQEAIQGLLGATATPTKKAANARRIGLLPQRSRVRP